MLTIEELLGGGKVREGVLREGRGAGIVADIKQAYKRYTDGRIQYNQNTSGHGWFCVGYAGLGCVSDLTGYEFDWAFRNEYYMLCKSDYGLVDKEGMFMDDGAEALCFLFNSKPELVDKFGELDFHEVIIHDEAETTYYLEKGYSLMVGTRITDKYMQDIKDGRIDDRWSGSRIITGHIMRLVRDGDNGRFVDHIENYEDDKSGYVPVNDIDINDFEKVRTNYYKVGYIFYFKNPKKPMEDLMKNIAYKKGDTPEEKEIVNAWLEEINKYGWKPVINNYTDKYYINKMQSEVIVSRAKRGYVNPLFNA